MRRYLRRLTLTSYVLYVVPLLMAIVWSLYLVGASIVLAVLLGLLYHLSNQRRFITADAIACGQLIACNALLVYFGSWTSPFLLAAIISLIIGLFCYLDGEKSNNYEWRHGLWHVAGAVVTIFCILTYTVPNE